MAAEFRIGTERFAASFDRTARDLQLPKESSHKRLKRSSWQQRKLYVEVINRDIARFDSTVRPEIKRYEITAKVVQVLSALLILAMPIFFSYLPAWFSLGVGFPTLLILSTIKAKVENIIEVKNHIYDALLAMRTLLMEQSTHALRPIGEWDLPAIDPRLKSDLMMQEDLKKKHPQSAKHLNRLLSNTSSCDCPDHPKPDKPKMRHCLDLEVSPFVMKNAVRQLVQIPDLKERWGAIREKVLEANGNLLNGDLDRYEKLMAEAKLEALLIKSPLEEMKPEVGKAQLNVLLSGSLPSPKNQVSGIVANFQYFNQIYKNELYPLYEEWNRLFNADFWQGRENFLQFARQVKEEIDRLVPLLARGEEVSEREWLEVLQVAKERRLQTMTDQLILQTRGLKGILKSQVESHPTKIIPKLKRSLENLNNKILSAGAIDYLEEWIENNPEDARHPIGEVMKLQRSEKQLLPKQNELDEWIGNNRQDARRPIRELVNVLPEEVGEWVRHNQWAMDRSLDALLYEPQIRRWLRLNEENQLLAQDSVIEIKERNHVMRFAFQEVEQQARSLVPALSQEDLNGFKQQLDALRRLISCRGESSRAGMVWKNFWRKLPPHGFDPIKIPKEKGWARANKIKELVIKKEIKAIDSKMIYLNRVRHYGLQAVAASIIFIVQAIFCSNPYVLWSLSAAGLLSQGLFIYFGDFIKWIDQQKQGVKLLGILQNEPQLKRMPGSRPLLFELKSTQNAYNLDGLDRTWARITTEGDEKVLSDPWREIARKGGESAEPALRRELRALLRFRNQEDETLLNLLAEGDATLLNLLAEANLTREAPWTAEEIQEYLEERINVLQGALYPIPKKQSPGPLNRLRNEVNQAAQSRRQTEEQLELIKSEKRKIERLAVYRFVGQKIAEAFQNQQEPQSEEDLNDVLQEIEEIVRRIYKKGGKREDIILLGQECEKLKYFRLEQLNSANEAFEKIKRKMEMWDQKFIQESLLFERVSGMINRLKEEVARDLPPLKRSYRIFQYIKDHLDEACLGRHERRGEGDLQALIYSISQLADRVDRGEEGAREEDLLQLCEQLKHYPLEQLRPWVNHFKSALMENNQRIQEQVKKQLHIEALQRRLPSFRIDESTSYQQLFQMEEDRKQELAQAFLQEKERKIRLALEKQVIKLDPEIAKKRNTLHKCVRNQGDPQIKRHLAQMVQQIEQFLEQQKKILSAALGSAENIEIITQALQTWRDRIQQAMERQAEGVPAQRLQQCIRALLQSELGIVVPLSDGNNLIPELKEVIYGDVPQIPPSNLEELELLFEEGLWDDHSNQARIRQISYRQKFNQLTLIERDSIWWRMPKGSREELV